MPASRNARLLYRAAKQRFEDAALLLELRRTTAAIYLAGYSVECMLKSLVLATVPLAQEEDILGMFRGARAHDYEWLMTLYREKGGARLPSHLVPHFTRVNSWSTDIRYSPGTAETREAAAFLESAFEIIQWADGRL